MTPYSTIRQDDLDTLILCAVRYSIGRQTYMPSLVQRITLTHLEQVSPGTKVTLAREIDDHIRMYKHAGSEEDTKEWLLFKDKLEESA